MNVTFVNDLDLCPDACPFADIKTMHQQSLSLGKCVMNVTVILACEHAEICEYRQTPEADVRTY